MNGTTRTLAAVAACLACNACDLGSIDDDQAEGRKAPPPAVHCKRSPELCK